ncbi:hypothetical protein B0H10DRAFT_2098764 [Mycena sp. CBHHK59/15]|nr:hypothetical protein B0H10DRAFT_2098764 [Mycena sp. CBHHK59/15]
MSGENSTNSDQSCVYLSYFLPGEDLRKYVCPVVGWEKPEIDPNACTWLHHKWRFSRENRLILCCSFEQSSSN